MRDNTSGTFELEVWQLSMDLVYDVYDITNTFPQHEIYSLTNQMRRAAVSIPSNIAEGKGKVSDRDLALFLGHARGSLHELHTQVLIAKRLGYLGDARAADVVEKIAPVGRMLNGLIGFATRSHHAPHGNN
jgi:four helix bundle protein